MPVRIRYHFDKAAGEVRELLIDDGDRNLPEHVHVDIARAIADELLVDAKIRRVSRLSTEDLLPDGETVPAKGSRRIKQSPSGSGGKPR